eukprot:2265775-Pleurochrysis_carterae.AAC.1
MAELQLVLDEASEEACKSGETANGALNGHGIDAECAHDRAEGNSSPGLMLHASLLPKTLTALSRQIASPAARRHCSTSASESSGDERDEHAPRASRFRPAALPVEPTRMPPKHFGESGMEDALRDALRRAEKAEAHAARMEAKASRLSSQLRHSAGNVKSES